MVVCTLTLDDRLISARADQSLLEAARDAQIRLPTLCYVTGLSAVGACRLCLVEIEGHSKLTPACVTRVAEGMVVHTQTERLQRYRRLIVEMLFAEGNHICSVCVANGHCELQDMAIAVGMDHVGLHYQHPHRSVDISHAQFGIDHNRCILCTRCIRVCDEVEGAHTWDMAGRGFQSHVITDLNQPWGAASSCTSCGKCVNACPTGAIFRRGSSVDEMEHDRSQLVFITTARQKRQWISPQQG